MSPRGPLWVAAGCAAGFAALAGPIAVDGGPLPGERAFLLELRDLRGDALDSALVRLAGLTDLIGLALAGVVIGGWLAWTRRWRELAYAGAVVAVVWSVNPVLKQLFSRTRPDLWDEPIQLSQYSFPSGHAANTAALAAALVLIAWRTAARRPTLYAAAGLVLVVGAGQLALGVHYPSDILAGWLWAAAWAAVVWSARDAPGASRLRP